MARKAVFAAGSLNQKLLEGNIDADLRGGPAFAEHVAERG